MVHIISLYKNRGFRGLFGAKFSEECAELSFFSGVLVQKQALKKVATIGYLIFLFWCLLLHVTTRL